MRRKARWQGGKGRISDDLRVESLSDPLLQRMTVLKTRIGCIKRMGIRQVEIVFCMHSLNSFPPWPLLLSSRTSLASLFFLPTTFFPQLSTFPRFKLKRIHSPVDTRRHFTLDQLLVPIFHFRILIFSTSRSSRTSLDNFYKIPAIFRASKLLLWTLQINRTIVAINICYIVRYF